MVSSPGASGPKVPWSQIIDPELVDAVLEDTGAREQRVRLLPARVVPYFVLALAFFERSSYQAVWGKLTAGLGAVAGARPCTSSLSRARRRLGSGPLRRLFEVLAGPVADRRQTCAFYRGLCLVAVDGTTLSAPDEKAVTWYPQARREGSYVRLPADPHGGPRGMRDACPAGRGLRPRRHR